MIGFRNILLWLLGNVGPDNKRQAWKRKQSVEVCTSMPQIVEELRGHAKLVSLSYNEIEPFETITQQYPSLMFGANLEKRLKPRLVEHERNKRLIFLLTSLRDYATTNGKENGGEVVKPIENSSSN